MGSGRSGILLGNSRLRCGSFDGGEVLESRALAYEELESAANREWLADFLRGAGLEIVVGSVCDERMDLLRSAGPDGAAGLLVAGRDFEIPVENLYDNPAEVGIDRLLNALAAGTRWPGEAVIVVDFGTAMSISVVSAGGEFLGGPIGAGVGTILHGLASETPHLPGLEAGPAVPLIAGSTAQALRAGVLGQVRGGVERLVQGVLQELGGEGRVVATGGEAEWVASELELFDSMVPELTLEGLAIAAETGARS